MAKKASIELSVSFMVKLIMAIVVFGFGLVIVRNIFSTAGSGELTESIDSEVESQIKILMDTGEKVIIFPEEITTERKNTAVFGLGVLNILDMPGATTFDTVVWCHSYVDPQGEMDENCPNPPDFFETYDALELENNEEGTVSIPVLPSNSDKGTYVFNAKVTYENDENSGTYGIVKFRVNVD
ncbi:MAG: hypothetical protein ACOC32_00845 [Nanoarchaeota archaeon]